MGNGIPFLPCRGDPPKNDNTKVTLGLARLLVAFLCRVGAFPQSGVTREIHAHELGPCKVTRKVLVIFYGAHYSIQTPFRYTKSKGFFATSRSLNLRACLPLGTKLLHIICSKR